jgi:hypothetical protein
VTAVQGEVYFRAKRAANFAPLPTNTTLCAEDVVWVKGPITPKERRGHVWLVWNSGAKADKLDVGSHTLVPQLGTLRPIEFGPGKRKYSPVLNTPANSVPAVVTPRAGTVISTRPSLAWQAVPGAKRYEITLMELGEAHSTVGESVIVQSTSTVYPEKWPTLQPDKRYRLVVQANGRSSSEEEQLALGFRVIGPVERNELRDYRAWLKAVQHQHATAAATERLLMAFTYAHAELFHDAIQLLESLDEHEHDPVTRRVLGELYLDTYRPKEAALSFRAAVKLAVSRKDRVAEAAASEGLATAYDWLGNLEAVQLRKKALELYRLLGDSDSMERIRAFNSATKSDGVLPSKAK